MMSGSNIDERMDDDDGNYSDWSSDGEGDQYLIKSLFSESTFSNVESMLRFDESTFGFSITEVIRGLGADIDETYIIRLINFIREYVSSLSRPYEQADNHSLVQKISALEYLDLRFMRPVLSEDSLLFLLLDHWEKQDSGFFDRCDLNQKESTATIVEEVSLNDAIELEATQKKLKACEDFIKELVMDTNTVGHGHPHSSEAIVENDSGYFGSYSQIYIHEEMLRDHHRTSSYASAISASMPSVRGKIVVDIGCGTGILCLMAARAGAKQVIGIDVSSIVERTRRVIEKNGFSSTITIVQGKLEESIEKIRQLLPCGEQVDVIISEWMGYGLYYENMLSSVIVARDSLMPGRSGSMMPSVSRIFLEAATSSAAENRVTFWNDVYGIFTTLKTIFNFLSFVGVFSFE